MSGTGVYGHRRDVSWTIAIVVTIIVAAFMVWLVMRSADDPGSLAVTDAPAASDPIGSPPATDGSIIAGSTSDPDVADGSTGSVTTLAGGIESGIDSGAVTIPPVGTDQVVAGSTIPSSSVALLPTTSVALLPTTGSTTTTTPSTIPPTTTPTTTPTTVAGPSYPTLADGSPVPVLGIFDGPVIRLSGNVRSEEARQQLNALAVANSKDPAPTVDDQLTIDPTVPPRIGVRVIEMDSVRFPDGSDFIAPEHAAELDRVAGILNLFPDVTVLVIGHSDQRGSAEQNFQISSDRAEAVRNYLVDAGTSPVRINSRAVGEEDLLTEGEDRASLALNRRTEFVFYGLLTDF